MIVAACGGTETPFTYNGTRWLYVWDTVEKRHWYLNLETDILSEDYR